MLHNMTHNIDCVNVELIILGLCTFIHLCLQMISFYYPRPVLAFGYCHRLRLCVCVCVRLCVCVYQSLACPRDNSSPVRARTTKFGQEMQKTLIKNPIVLGGDWPWRSRSNLTSKSKFTPFWAFPPHNSSSVDARIAKLGPPVQNKMVKIPIVLGIDWCWSSCQFWYFSTKVISAALCYV